MKAMVVRIGYGKNNVYISANWVVENAIEVYKAKQTEFIRSYGYTRDINFTITSTTELDPNGTGTILAYTLHGFDEVKVK